MKARVRWFNNRRGWGFVVLPDGREAFVHHRAVESAGFKALHPGQEIECEVEEDERGLRAIQVRPLP